MDDACLILLGASSWPNIEQLDDSGSFVETKKEFESYFRKLLDCEDDSRVLDLFESDLEPIGIIRAIEDFLETNADICRNLFLLYTGHGHVSRQQQFLLSLKSSEADKRELTSLRTLDIAATLFRKTKNCHAFIFLDSCFSAKALSDFQFQSDDPINELLAQSIQEIEVPTGSATVMFCASSSKNVAALPNDDTKKTLFGEAVLDTLWSGANNNTSMLSIQDIARLSKTYLARHYKGAAPLPEIHCPMGQNEGILERDIFPNFFEIPDDGVFAVFVLKTQLEASRRENREVKKEIERLRDQVASGQAASERPNEYNEGLGFFAGGFLSEIIDETKEFLDISIGRPKLFNWDTMGKLNRACRRGVTVRCVSLSENSNLTILEDAIQTVTNPAPKDGESYQDELRDLNKGISQQASFWQTSELEKIAYFTNTNIPRASFVRSDDKFYLGFLNLYNETHAIYPDDRPYLVCPFNSEVGKILGIHFETLIRKPSTERLFGTLEVNPD